ncbi:MAG: hypothetical protein AB8G18_13235 [Gammaproteobacteria bacterium]
MSNEAEILLSTAQNLRGYLAQHPQARADVATIETHWLPVELFPPERTVVLQAINVLVNAGELVAVGSEDNPVYCAKAPLDLVAGY